jgi:hypothetical protein
VTWCSPRSKPVSRTSGSPTVQLHGARAALAETAAELRRQRIQVVAQHIQERRLRLDFHALAPPLTVNSMFCAMRESPTADCVK